MQSELKVSGMDCASCAQKIEKSLKKLDGVKEIEVNFVSEKVEIEFDEDKISLDEIKGEIVKLGYEVEEKKDKEETGEKENKTYQFIRLSGVLVLIILSFSKILKPYVPFDFPALIATIWGGYPFVRQLFFIVKNKSINADAFMGIAILSAALLGEFLSASVIALFMLFAKFLEEYTIERARKAIRDLIETAPKKVIIERDGKEMELNIEDIKHTDIVLVKAGGKIPVDGTVIEGSASVNQSPITGESMPVEKNKGDEVYAGTINELGFLKLSIRKVGRDTTLGRIIELVEKAQSSKAPVQRVADVFTNYFTPVVLLVFVLTLIITRNFVTAITVLVIACPCAVALATPLSVVAGIGKASKRGILIKGGIYLETLGKIDTLVLDKTGTLTIGEPRVVEVKGFENHNEKEIIEFASIAEKNSEHPLAKAIIKKAEEYKIEISEPKDFLVIRGKGVICSFDDKKIILGSRELLKENGVNIKNETEEYIREREEQGKTCLLVAHDKELCGIISVSDIIRPKAKETISKLKKIGIKNIIMLTGDNERTAKAIAKDLGIDKVFSGMSPEDKLNKVSELSKNNYVAMVGDGINDAPALAKANVGIAMGVIGTDAAIESADVALMNDDLLKIFEAVYIGRKTFSTIKQNIVVGILFNVVGVSLACSGLLTPMEAAVAHILPDVLVFVNSARLLK